MSILISVTEERNRQGEQSPAVPKLYGAPFITNIQDVNGRTSVILDGKRENEERIVSESYATVLAVASAGYGDFFLALTRDNGGAIAINASRVVEAYDGGAGAFVRVRDEEKIEDTIYEVTENIAAITALIPVTTTFKEYSALLSQAGTSAPYEDDLDGNTGNTPFTDDFGGVWSYQAVGTFRYTKVGAFTDVTKIKTEFGDNAANQGADVACRIIRIDNDTLQLTSNVMTSFSGALQTATNSKLYLQPITIKVYN